jgi:hypothetical protein
MFRKSKNNKAIELATKSEFLFQEMVKETMELHEDLKSEFEVIENVVTEFQEFAAVISNNLNDEQKARLEDFISRLNRVNHYTQPISRYRK